VSELGKSRALIERWSAKWGWVERAQAWDDFQETKRLEARIEEKQKMDEVHLRIVRGMRSKAIDALAKMEPEQLAKNMQEMRLDQRDHQAGEVDHG
jgi:predicted secreted protein